LLPPQPLHLPRMILLALRRRHPRKRLLPKLRLLTILSVLLLLHRPKHLLLPRQLVAMIRLQIFRRLLLPLPPLPMIPSVMLVVRRRCQRRKTPRRKTRLVETSWRRVGLFRLLKSKKSTPSTRSILKLASGFARLGVPR